MPPVVYSHRSQAVLATPEPHRSQRRRSGTCTTPAGAPNMRSGGTVACSPVAPLVKQRIVFTPTAAPGWFAFQGPLELHAASHQILLNPTRPNRAPVTGSNAPLIQRCALASAAAFLLERRPLFATRTTPSRHAHSRLGWLWLRPGALQGSPPQSSYRFCALHFGQGFHSGCGEVAAALNRAMLLSARLVVIRGNPHGSLSMTE